MRCAGPLSAVRGRRPAPGAAGPPPARDPPLPRRHALARRAFCLCAQLNLTRLVVRSCLKVIVIVSCAVCTHSRSAVRRVESASGQCWWWSQVAARAADSGAREPEGSDRGRDLEPRQRERRSVRHGVRRGGAGGRLPRARTPAPRARAPRAFTHGALARQVWPARQFQRQGRGEGAAREVPDGQVRQPPDGADPQAPSRRDVALRRAAEALRYEGGRGSGQLAGGGGGHRRAAGHGQRRAPPPTPHDITSRCQKTSKRCTYNNDP